MMRIAIAGTSGLARILAYHINETAHQFIIFSRQPQIELTNNGYQVVVVNYDNQDDLRFNLRGVDLVISTVSGIPQINLIDAAANSSVQRFVPAEFEGPPARRPRNDPLDRGRAAALERLRHWTHQARCEMRYTVITCGVFYERFARGGLASVGIGFSTRADYQGAYLMDIESSTAEIVERNSAGRNVYLCLTSANDVGRFLAAALNFNITQWPGEYRIAGSRLTISELLSWAEAIKGGAPFTTQTYQASDLAVNIEYATYELDYARANRLQELLATAEQRRYDFDRPNLNELVNIAPEPFWDWLRAHWGAM